MLVTTAVNGGQALLGYQGLLDSTGQVQLAELPSI